MTPIHSALLLPLALLAVAATAAAHSPAREVPYAVSIQSGYGFGAGTWQEHRYADVNQFNNDLVVLGDFEIGFDTPADRNDTAPSPFKIWSAALIISYTRLSTSEWEDYVRERGESIESSAGIWHFDAVLRRRLVTTREHLLRFEFGGGLALASSSEKYRDMNYDYDFLAKTRAELMLGVLYDWKFNSYAGMTLRAGFIWAGNGVRYADGDERGIIMFPLTAGLRFYL